MEPSGDGAALGWGAEDGEVGEKLEEAAAAGAEGAVEGGGDERTERAWGEKERAEVCQRGRLVGRGK